MNVVSKKIFTEIHIIKMRYLLSHFNVDIDSAFINIELNIGRHKFQLICIRVIPSSR